MYSDLTIRAVWAAHDVAAYRAGLISIDDLPATDSLTAADFYRWVDEELNKN